MRSANSPDVTASQLNTSFDEDDEFEGAVGGLGTGRDNDEAAMFDSDDAEEEEEEEDELNLSSQSESFTPLLSLTSYSTPASTQPDDEEEGRGWMSGAKNWELGGDSARRQSPLPSDASPRMGLKTKKLYKHRSSAETVPAIPSAPLPRAPVQLEPVGLFWDIENCPVPVDKSAFALANKMRKEFFQGKREAEFMCVCDITKERKEVVEGLSKAHVS